MCGRPGSSVLVGFTRVRQPRCLCMHALLLYRRAHAYIGSAVLNRDDPVSAGSATWADGVCRCARKLVLCNLYIW